MEQQKIRVFGIDPAPAKGLWCFPSVTCKDNEEGPNEKTKNPAAPAIAAIERIEEDAVGDAITLVCWDAPLTGPPSIYVQRALRNASSEKHNPNPFAQRAVERFFSRKDWNHKAPSGISVQPYSGCSHWAISRALVGLPLTGKYDHEYRRLPFKLLTDEHERANLKTGQKYIVEVHPAVAIWLWLKKPGTEGSDRDWRYKGTKNAANRERIVEDLLRVDAVRKAIANPGDCTLKEDEIKNEMVASDDMLDAFVAWVLGTRWFRGNNEVVLLGNVDTGCMLLPESDYLQEWWQKCCSGARSIR